MLGVEAFSSPKKKSVNTKEAANLLTSQPRQNSLQLESPTRLANSQRKIQKLCVYSCPPWSKVKSIPWNFSGVNKAVPVHHGLPTGLNDCTPQPHNKVNAQSGEGMWAPSTDNQVGQTLPDRPPLWAPTREPKVSPNFPQIPITYQTHLSLIVTLCCRLLVESFRVPVAN